MSAYADITINESRLLRAIGAPTIADCIRNPGYRPTYSYSIACPISMNPPCKHGEFTAAVQDFHNKIQKMPTYNYFGALMEKNKRRVGAFYEKQAADYLISQGVMILERNYRNRFGEIDLIGMTADGWLIFVEVKYRSSEYSGNPLAAVNSKKQRVISLVALEFLKNRYRSMDVRCRFDVVGIEGSEICWVKNAFDFCC